MNKILTIALTYISISMYSFAATEFNMTFSTVAPGGSYNPKNVVAVWVTQTNGTFVKTILRYAGGHKDALTTWTTAAGTSDADAVLGATRANHSAPVTMTATWDLKNTSGTVVPDGTYRINLECADGTRKAHSFSFVKDGIAGTRTDPGAANFKNISINYAPPGPPNAAPVAKAQSVTNAEDTAKAITLTATDAETNALTYAIVTSPLHGTLSGTPPSVTYMPATNYYGSDSFTFKANDGIADSAPATVSITVNAVNDAPVAQAQSVSTSEDVAKAITLTATDADGNTLTYTVVIGPTNGTLSGSAPNVTYTPSANYYGPDSFTFRANDAGLTSTPAVVSISVTAVNDAPVAQAQSVSTSEDVAKAITLTATDAETNALTYAIVTSPLHGTLSGTPPSVTYTPVTNYYGSDSVTFKANDGIADSTLATVSITVTPVNDAPIAQNQSVSAQRDVAKAVTLGAIDIETNTLTYAIVTSPAHGALGGIAPNVTYTPATSYTGPDSFTFKANDGMTDSAPATVSITVTINVAPVADSQSVSTVKNTAKSITLTATDAETNALTYAIVVSPSNGILSGIAPNVTYTPVTNYTGPDSLTFSAFDGTSTGNLATVSITVNDIQYALTVNSGSGGGSYTNGAQVIIAANDPAAGEVFDRWTGAIQYVASATSSPTTVTMPPTNISLTATYKAAYYALTVNGGTGSGSYTNGQRVTINATIPAGWAFDQWNDGNTNGMRIITMSATSVVYTASFKDIQIPVLTISSPVNGARLTNATVTVSGRATDNGGAANVLIRLNTGSWTTNNILLSTTNWTADLTLAPGTNVLQAYARDAEGNNSLTSSVVCTYAAYGELTIQTNGPGTVTRLPTGVPEVGKSYTLTAVPPKTGSSFSSWSGDAAGTNKVLTFVMTSNMTIAANFIDTLRPTLAITAPTATLRVTNAVFTVKGTAADNLSLSNVLVQLNNGSWADAGTTNGLKNWSLPVMLTPGTNTIRAYSVDTMGNNSLTASVVFTYVIYGNLTIQTNGPGAVTRLPIGVPEIGKSYTLTAVPPKIGSAFSSWSGDAAGTNKVLSFVMTSNMTIAANFIDNLKPTVVITAPTAALRILGTNGLFTVRGTAVDNLSLSNVLVQLNGGSWEDAASTNGYKNWSLPVMLAEKTNTIRACSVDTTGNHSLTSSVVCVYVVTGALSIQTNGPGTVTRLPIGVPEVGKSYTLTAVPAKIGSAFSGWSGDSTSTNKVLTFVMTSNKTFTANFIDTLKPTVVITYPTALLRVVANGTVVLRGTAADSGGLGEVRYQLYTGGWTNAVTTNGWKNWTAEYSPVSGLNTAKVYSVDVQGNISATSTVVFTYVPGAVMAVQINGTGTITPAYNGQALEIGKSYIMTAKAAKTSVFTNWTYGIGGPVATNKTIVTFVMQSNLVLTANFQSLLAPKVALASAIAAPATPRAAIVVDGSSKDWANVPRSSFGYASVTQEVAVALDGNNIALLLNSCPFDTSDNVLVYFKLHLIYGTGDTRHSVDLWTSGSVLYGMVDGQVITGLEAVLLNGVLEVKLPVDQAPSQVTIEEVCCGLDLGGGTLTELFKLTLP